MNLQKQKRMPGAWICLNEKSNQNRGRLKIHRFNKIYLKDNDEFEIELFNPTKNNIKAEIKIDGKSILQGGLIIKRGERIYLDCFPDTLKKFMFRTYEVENTEEIKDSIKENGKIEIKFYKEYINNFCGYWYTNTNIYNNLNNTNPYDFYTYSSNTNGSFSKQSLTTDTNTKIFNSIETGQTEGINNSDQRFESIDMKFDMFSFHSIEYQLLPISQKPFNKKDINKIKRGRKRKRNTNISNKLDDLLKLKELFDNKVITEDEFKKIKKEII